MRQRLPRILRKAWWSTCLLAWVLVIVIVVSDRASQYALGLADNVYFAIFDRVAFLIEKPIYYKRSCGLSEINVLARRFNLVRAKTREWDCGFLYVAEVRESPDGNVVRIPVINFRSTSTYRKLDPVLFINGGPGASSLTELPWAALWYEQLTEMEYWLGNRDLIVFDHRGAGGSKPSFECPQYDWLSPYLGSEVSLEEHLKPLFACRDGLAEDGVDLSAYNTDSIVADIEDLQNELGIESWNVWGASYGSRIALALLRADPEGIRSLILEGVLPPGIGDKTNDPKSFVESLTRVFSVCRNRERCNSLYPRLERQLFETVEALRKNPISLEVKRRSIVDDEFQKGEGVKVQVDDVLFLDIIFEQLYSSVGISELPRLIFGASKGYFNPLREAIQSEDLSNWLVRTLASKTITATTGSPSNWFDDVLFLDIIFEQLYSNPLREAIQSEDLSNWLVRTLASKTIHCNDGVQPSSDNRPNDWVPPPYLRRWGDTERLYDACDRWTKGLQKEPRRATSYPEVPTILLAGAFDPVTPPKLAVEVHKSLPMGFLYVLPGTSHDASGKRCAQSIMRDFLNNPREEAVNDCLLVEELSVFKDPGFHPTSEPETFRDAAPEERGQY